MSENHEPNSPSEDSSAPEPESIIPEDAVELETKEADQQAVAKVEEVVEPPLPEMVVEPLSQPHRVVLYLKYDELRKRFDEYWTSRIGAALEGKPVKLLPEEEGFMKVLRHLKGKKGKGGKMRNAQKLAESRIPVSRLYHLVLGQLINERVGRDVLFVEAADVFNFEPGKQSGLGAVVHFTPELEMQGEINWECARPKIPPKQQQFELRVKELQREHRTLKDDSEGVIAEQSNVCVDIDAKIDGEQYAGGTMSRQWVELGGIPIPELKAHLIGRKVGDEFECDFPANARDTEYGGQPVHATIRIHNLQQIEVPGVDDGLAKDAGFDDLKSFEERFSSDYDSYIKRAEQSVLSEHVIQQIAGESPLPPLSMAWVKLQTDMMVAEHVAGYRGDKRQALAAIGATDQAHMEEYLRGQLYHQFMQQLAFRAYAKMFEVEPGSDEMFDSMLEKVRWTDDKEA